MQYGGDYNGKYNSNYDGKYNIISILKLHYWECFQIRSWLSLGDPKLHNYDGNWQLWIYFQWKSNQSIFATQPLEISLWLSNVFQKWGITVPELQTILTMNKYRPRSVGTKHYKIELLIQKMSNC